MPDETRRTPLRLDFPFTGRWVARNSPANRVPSHGTNAYGSTYAIDFVRLDLRNRSAARGWRSWVSTEPPEGFVGFGAPILAPLAGTVVIAEDGEPDHEARRSLFAGLPYLLTQQGRIRRGTRGIAGNHVVIAADAGGFFVLVAHLRRGSVCVTPGEVVRAGALIGTCGNSGNSTEPHVHLQATDSTDWATARGIPISFGREGRECLPRDGEVFEASPPGT